jgi:flavodoxin/NAD-dependent dihydropyrimidine dehydrogenase PreA subunit
MRTLLICFSQTGNTRKVAEGIRDGITGVAGSCELVTLEDVQREELGEFDLVGLGCPVFYLKEPLHVRDFIRGLPDLEGKRWFVFCTHGAVMGPTLISMSEGLKKKGIRVIGHHHSYADGTMPYYPHPVLTTGHPDQADLDHASEFGREVARRSRSIAIGEPVEIPEPEPAAEEWVTQSNQLTVEFLGKVSPKLRIDMDTCDQCNECVESCPVDGIDVSTDPPRIQDPCLYCWHCAKICPTLAIEADWDPLVAMAPGFWARYRRELEQAEARGEFRWLVDRDSLDFDNPLYKQRQRTLEESD